MQKYRCYYLNDFNDDYDAMSETDEYGDWYRVYDVDPIRARLVEAETALLNAMMGNANAVAEYLNKYPDPYSVS